MASKLQLRRGTAAEWISVNPILAEGEPGIELDTNKFKLGNGISAWNALPYSTTDTTAITTALNAEIIRATTAEGLLAPKSTTYTKTEVDTALSGKASAITNTGDETTATIKSKLGITTLSGSNTGDQTTITGNAGTATTLQNARTINGVSFDGSANITINAVDSTARVATSAVGAASGVVPLGSDSKIASTYLPSYVDDVLEFANLAGFPTTGEAGKIYVALDTNKTYRWGGSSYTYITSGAIDSISVTAPISSTGGATPTIGINAATTSTDGSMSAADKTKLDAVNTSALVKTGGTVGQVLTKVDATDFNTQWTTPTAGGTIDSVVAPLTYNVTTKQLSTDGTVVINGGTVPVGFGGLASATAEVTITEVGLANSGSLAGSALDLSQTWNTTGNPTAIKLNVTNTASGTTSKLMDLQVGGSSKFSVDKLGKLLGPNDAFRISAFSTNHIILMQVNVPIVSLVFAEGCMRLARNYGIAWANADYDSNSPTDLRLDRDAANTLAQRNSTNSQTSRIYNTYTDASNYERSALSFVTYSGALYTKLAAESAGTGAANIGIALSPKGTGAITAQVPDGTVAGGNARGVNSVDLQQKRGLVANVASADYASIVGGQDNTASGVFSSVLGGYSNKATAYGAVAMCRAAIADKPNQVAAGIAGQFFSQHCTLGLAGATTDATLTQIFLGHDTNNKTTIPNSTTWAAGSGHRHCCSFNFRC